MPVVKKCEHCGNSFTTPARRSETVKYCSRACKTKAGWETVKCETCGASYKRKKSAGSRSVKNYCSAACYHVARVGVPIPRKTRVRYYRVCETCHKEFKVTQTRKDTARWCSRECQKASPTFKAECSEKQQGDKHWRWSGGLYKTHEGYIRHKRKVDGMETHAFNHRVVLLSAMLQAVPNHPFIIEVDGERKLNSDIEVHHIDRNRSNNALENLLAVTKFAHAQIHHHNRKPKPYECWPENPSRW